MSSFEEQGVQFKTISPDMYEDVMDFLWTHFFPDEPVLRSIGLERLEFIDKNVFPETFNHKCSIAAVDASGNILAVRVGGIKTKGDWPAWVVDKIFQNFPYKLLSRFLPPAMHKMPIFVKLNKKIGFNTWNMMDVWNCRSVFEGLAVCSARTHGIKGLGSEVVKRSDQLAKDKGATHVFDLVTGNYSRKIFSGLGYTHLNTVTYDEFRDEQGELYLKDTREHIAATTWYKVL